MSGTPRTDVYENSILDAEVTKHPHREFKGAIRFAQQLERELADCRAMLKSWYEAGSPYATAEALREALAQRPEAVPLVLTVGGAPVDRNAAIEAVAACTDQLSVEVYPAIEGEAALEWAKRAYMNVSRSSEEK